jgi:hypothetical protein
MGSLDEGDVIAQEHADAVALLDAELLQAKGDAVGALGDFRMGAPAFARDDAEEKLGRFH